MSATEIARCEGELAAHPEAFSEDLEPRPATEPEPGLEYRFRICSRSSRSNASRNPCFLSLRKICLIAACSALSSNKCLLLKEEHDRLEGQTVGDTDIG